MSPIAVSKTLLRFDAFACPRAEVPSPNPGPALPQTPRGDWCPALSPLLGEAAPSPRSEPPPRAPAQAANAGLVPRSQHPSCSHQSPSPAAPPCSSGVRAPLVPACPNTERAPRGFSTKAWTLRGLTVTGLLVCVQQPWERVLLHQAQGGAWQPRESGAQEPRRPGWPGPGQAQSPGKDNALNPGLVASWWGVRAGGHLRRQQRL